MNIKGIMCQLTRALGHTDGAILVFGIGIGLQFECVLVVDECLGTQRHAGARVVEVPASLKSVTYTQQSL